MTSEITFGIFAQLIVPSNTINKKVIEEQFKGFLMKNFLLLILLVLCVSTVVEAQEDTSSVRTPEFQFSSGLSIPSIPSEFRDYWKNGITVGLGFGYSFAQGSFGYGGIHALLEYNRFTFDDSGFIKSNNLSVSGLTLTGESRSTITLMTIFKGTITTNRNSIAPYFLLGIGYFYRSSYSINATLPGTGIIYEEGSKSAISWSVGAGVDVPISDRLVLFLQGKFILGVTGSPGTQYYPLNAGLRFRM
ncbi:MAG TPA: hypothetical protein VFF29_03015 [Bacteroidota bacterium]|nr:hypothetical protein [Bacteroidota bacterium]